MLLLHKKGIPLSQRKQKVAKSYESNNLGCHDTSGGGHLFLVTHYIIIEWRTLSHALLHYSFLCQLGCKYLFRGRWVSDHQINRALQPKPIANNRRWRNHRKPSSNAHKTGDSPQIKINQKHVDYHRLLLSFFYMADLIRCDPLLF